MNKTLNLPDDPVLVLISANGEWQIVLSLLNPPVVEKTPLGDCFLYQIEEESVLFFNSGWGKTRSAAATQYLIDKYSPALLINAGTCGGLEGLVNVGEVLLAESTVMYDILERMSDPEEAIDFYRATLDLSWLPEDLPENTRITRIGSADQDIDHKNFYSLRDTFGVAAADWESAPIAWVAQANSVKCLILRGVSDLVHPAASETDSNVELWLERSRQIMQKLIDDLPFYIREFRKN